MLGTNAIGYTLEKNRPLTLARPTSTGPRCPPNQTAHPCWIPFAASAGNAGGYSHHPTVSSPRFNRPPRPDHDTDEPADSSYPHSTLVSWRFYRGYFPLCHSARSHPLWSSIFAAELEVGNFVDTFGGQVLRNHWKGAVILGCV